MKQTVVALRFKVSQAPTIEVNAESPFHGLRVVNGGGELKWFKRGPGGRRYSCFW